jgi:drebrin-like protein
VSAKPAEEDRIGPVGTNYTPVSLPRPKKLVNPFEKMSQEQETQPVPQPVKRGGGMSWSERQAIAKKRAEEEEVQSRAVSASVPSSASGSKWKPPGATFGGVGAAAVASRQDDEERQDDEDWDVVSLLV